MSIQQSRFQDFYKHVFLLEHRRPVNVALHVFGTIIGIAFLVTVSFSSAPWLALAFPIVHAAPGLIGHRLFERNSAVGDLRMMRKDYSPLCFIAANHLMTIELWLKGFYWRDFAAHPKRAGHDA